MAQRGRLYQLELGKPVGLLLLRGSGDTVLLHHGKDGPLYQQLDPPGVSS